MMSLDPEHTGRHKRLDKQAWKEATPKRGGEDFETTEMNFEFPVDHMTGIGTWLCNSEG